jgi:hypothetical protein
MYRNCIFCSAAFGTNESLETFPVGRQLAFDAWRGRLWAVCPVCGRWNLSPIEERWEAVEEAEKLFRAARLRVQSENVGLAKLLDGTRLVRVGQAVPGELAAWRYGTQLLRRRKRHFLLGGLSSAAVLAVYGGATALGGGTIAVMVGVQVLENRRKRKVLYRLPAAEDPSGRGAIIRRWHLDGMNLDAGAGGELELHIRDGHREDPKWRLVPRERRFFPFEVDRRSGDVVVVSGDVARAVLARAMIHVNHAGASRATLERADHILAEVGSAEGIIQEAAAGGAALGRRAGRDPEVLVGPAALAFEMALNEASEREALAGELAALERAWKEAEEIAAIADALPGEATLNRLLARLTG